MTIFWTIVATVSLGWFVLIACGVLQPWSLLTITLLTLASQLLSAIVQALRAAAKP